MAKGLRFKKWRAPKPTPASFVVGLRQLGAGSVSSGVLLEATVTNRDTEPRTYSTYYTPFEGFLNDIVEVVDAQGARAAFLGPLVDRGPPGPDNFEVLRPGEIHGVHFDLAAEYKLAAGHYSVRTHSSEWIPASNAIDATVAASGPPNAAKKSGVETVLTVEPGASASRGVAVRLAVYNHDAESHRFCNYHTPFEGMRNDFLEIVDTSGARQPYRGMMAKRAPPTDEDVVTIHPNHFRAQVIDLREGYELTPGTYRARFFGASMNGLPSSDFVSFSVAP
jgi:hypothetical protein